MEAVPLPGLKAAHRWALGPLYEAAGERVESGATRFPDLETLVRRATGPELLLDRFIEEVGAEAKRSGRDDEWKTYALSRLFTAWAEVDPSAHKIRRETSRALTDRRSSIVAAARALKATLEKNETMGPLEAAAGLRPFPVTVRFPGLFPMLDEVMAWAARDDVRAPTLSKGSAPARFLEAAIAVLGFQPTWRCLADLWNLFANDADNEMTDDKMRIAADRANSRTK